MSIFVVLDIVSSTLLFYLYDKLDDGAFSPTLTSGTNVVQPWYCKLVDHVLLPLHQVVLLIGANAVVSG